MVKKITKTVLALMIVFSVLGIRTSAEEYYSFSCGTDFEISYIKDDGTFEKHSCTNNFNDAVEVMKSLGNDYVVRHDKSYSPTKIVAMNSGKAYTYPSRSGNPTLNIYQDVNNTSSFEYKKTYVANHYEMEYWETERYFPKSGTGMVKVSLNGFTGYSDLEYVDLVPDKFIDKGLAIFLGGNDITAENEQPFKVINRRNYYENRKGELVYVYHRAYCSPQNINKNDLEYSIVIGVAPNEMAEGVKYYSYNGYEFYTSPKYDNLAFTHYPYYQFLPVRTKSNLTAEELDMAFATLKGNITSSMKNTGAYFIKAQEEYGINALLLYAMGAHESGWGTSYLSKNYNNLFGWNAVDSDPSQASKFESVETGILEHAGYNLRKYTDINNPLFFSSSLGNKGSGFNVKYASDPYWGMKISSIAYQIDKIYGLKDYNQHQLAIVSKFDAEFKREDGSVLYTAQYGPYYQENFVVAVLEDGENVKVQSTNPIADGKIITIANAPNQLVKYDFLSSVAYVSSQDLDPLNYKETFRILDIKWSDNKILVETNAEKTILKLNELTFENEIDVSELAEGQYKLYVNDQEVKLELENKLVGSKKVSFADGFMTIENRQANIRNMMIVDKFEVSDNTLNLSGKAFVSGQDYLDKGTHKLVLHSYADNETAYEFDLETVKVENFSLNDEFYYDWVGYNGQINLTDIAKGEYYLSIKVNDEADILLNSTNVNHALIVSDTDDLTYKFKTNSLLNYRMELEVLGKQMNYSAITKPSIRDSLVSYTTIDLNKNLDITGYGFIYYLDHGFDNNTEYKISLVAQDGTKYELDTQKRECPYNYAEVLKSKRNLDDICFKGNIELKDVQDGIYRLMVEMKTNNDKEYYDILPYQDRQQREYTPFETDDRIYKITVDNRYNINLEIATK